MRILIIGRKGLPDSYFRSFSKLNHEVELINPLDFYPSYNLFVKRPIKPLFFFILSFLSQSKLIDKATNFNPDLIVVFKGLYLSFKTLKKIKINVDSSIFYYSPDDLKNSLNTNFLITNCMPLYDCAFTPRKVAVNEIKKEYGIRAEYLPFALDSTNHSPVELTKKQKEEFGSDILFIGTYAKDKRVEYLDKLCKDGYDIKIYGNDWNRLPKSECLHKRDCIQNKPIYGDNYCRAIISSKVSLCFLRTENRDKHTMRTFEIPGCGGFLLHEKTDESLKFFKKEKEADFFCSYEEMKEKIDYYLSHPKERKIISRNGYEKASTYDYSYDSRAKKIIRVYKDVE